MASLEFLHFVLPCIYLFTERLKRKVIFIDQRLIESNWISERNLYYVHSKNIKAIYYYVYASGKQKHLSFFF